MEQISEAGRYTLTVTFRQPTGLFPEFLARTGTIILPAAVAERVGRDRLPDELCIGTGPFKLLEHISDRHIRMGRWENIHPARRYQTALQVGYSPTWTRSFLSPCLRIRSGPTERSPASIILPRGFSSTITAGSKASPGLSPCWGCLLATWGLF